MHRQVVHQLVRSRSTLDIGDTSADAASWRLLRSAEDPENEDITAAFASVVVCC